MWLNDIFSKTLEAAWNIGRKAWNFIDWATKGALEATHNEALLHALKQNIEQVDHIKDNLSDYPTYQRIAEQLKGIGKEWSYEDFLDEIVSDTSLFTNIMAIDVDNFAKQYDGKNDTTVVALAAIHYISDEIHRLVVNREQQAIEGSVAIRNNGKNFEVVVKDKDNNWTSYKKGSVRSEDHGLFNLPQIVWFHRFDNSWYKTTDNQATIIQTQKIDPKAEAEKLTQTTVQTPPTDQAKAA